MSRVRQSDGDNDDGTRLFVVETEHLVHRMYDHAPDQGVEYGFPNKRHKFESLGDVEEMTMKVGRAGPVCREQETEQDPRVDHLSAGVSPGDGYHDPVQETEYGRKGDRKYLI